MASDALKTAVAEAVQYAVNDHVGNHIRDEYWAGNVSPPTVEVNDLSTLETTIRISGIEGAPRYFIVKVSEQL